MNSKIFIFLYVATLFSFLACESRDPNIDSQGQDEFKALEVTGPVIATNLPFQDKIYVPIYSDIYVRKSNQNALLAATLSIRNTSEQHTLYVSQINYFNTKGDLVKSYLDKTISLSPMETINYVIERDDDTGGSGANFMVSLSANNEKVKPLIQAIMIGHIGNIGFSFSTDGYSVE